MRRHIGIPTAMGLALAANLLAAPDPETSGFAEEYSLDAAASEAAADLCAGADIKPTIVLPERCQPLLEPSVALVDFAGLPRQLEFDTRAVADLASAAIYRATDGMLRPAIEVIEPGDEAEQALQKAQPSLAARGCVTYTDQKSWLSMVARASMEELNGYDAVVAIGGLSCPSGADGKLAGGYADYRLESADVYTNRPISIRSKYQALSDEVKIAGTVAHEYLHLKRLGHAGRSWCPEEMDPDPLSAAGDLKEMLGPGCDLFGGYEATETHDSGNIMSYQGLNLEDPAARLLNPMQRDFIASGAVAARRNSGIEIQCGGQANVITDRPGSGLPHHAFMLLSALDTVDLRVYGRGYDTLHFTAPSKEPGLEVYLSGIDTSGFFNTMRIGTLAFGSPGMQLKEEGSTVQAETLPDGTFSIVCEPGAVDTTQR